MDIQFDEDGVVINTHVIDPEAIKEKKRRKFYNSLAGLATSSMLIAATIAYIVLGLNLKNGWSDYWFIFFFSLLPGELIRFVGYKKFEAFPIWDICLSIFFLFGAYFKNWSPSWAILLLVPIYYILVPSIKNFFRVKEDYNSSK